MEVEEALLTVERVLFSSGFISLLGKQPDFRLGVWVLKQALIDACQDDDVELKYEALEWLLHTDDISFVWCCRLMRCDAVFMRRKLIELFKKQEETDFTVASIIPGNRRIKRL